MLIYRTVYYTTVAITSGAQCTMIIMREKATDNGRLRANWGCLPATEVNLGCRIRNDGGAEPLVRRAWAVVLELHVIVHEDMGKDDLELVASEESARADVHDE